MKYINLKDSKNNKGLGLVEVLVSLAIVSTGMVVITSLSLKTIKEARNNEMQDVSVQIGAQAMDYLKQPSEIEVNDLERPTELEERSYKLDFGTSLPILKRVSRSPLNGREINDCEDDSDYIVDVVTDFNLCQQVLIRKNADKDNHYNIRVIVVWKASGGESRKRVETGTRIGFIK